LRLAGVAASVAGATPAPDKGRFTAGALLAKAIFPVAEPAACGANATEKLTV
jgi:hypothetical protein